MPEETSDSALKLIEVFPADAGGELFAASDEFTDSWWEPMDLDMASEHCFAAVVGDREIARILALERATGPDPDEWAIPVFGKTIQIELFEVARSARRSGFGTAVIEQLSSRYEGTWLMAFSEGADDFWGSLGWVCYRHPSDPGRQALFIRRPSRP